MKKAYVYILLNLLIISLAGCTPKSAPVKVREIQTIADDQLAETTQSSSRKFGKGEMILNLAQSYLGTPYRYGGNDPHGFDCSGLVQYIHKIAGISIPRTARAQARAARPVTFNALKPGDVIFFKQNLRQISHVGIYAGNGQFIHAPNQGGHVRYTSLSNSYWSQHFAAAGRFY